MKNLTSLLQQIDRFGHKVSLHYQGDSDFKTVFGALVTVMVYTLIMINAVTICLDYVNNDN